MKKLFCSIVAKAQARKLEAKDNLVRFVGDIAGSDTTEKIGMVVVAIVIVGILATIINSVMPNFFKDIFKSALDKLNEIFGTFTAS